MGIADLFRPKYRHSNARVRAEAVKALTGDDAAILIQVARTDRDIGVRRLAMEKIDEAEALADIAAAETERSLRDFAGERAAGLWMQHATGDDAERAGAALGGIIKLGDQHALVEVVVRAEVAAVRKRAFGELRDPRALGELAKSDGPQDLRIAAVARIDDGDVLRALAIDTTLKEVGLAAVDKIDDPDRLENVAQKAKNKAVRQRARKIVTEMEEAERAKKPGTPDEVKRQRAEKAQLVREMEAIADTFDFAKLEASVRAAQAAWAKLALGGDADDRFTRAVERFWKRKELHESQSRTADELRAVEREAARERERAAAERAAAAKPVAAVEPELAADDPIRLAREAEAQARHAEQERQRAEDEARRQAQVAERAARQQEDAERGAAIAASLGAMCDELEQLAASSAKDGRAIDRLLQQAAKSFEQIGKVPTAERDPIADRYRAARGKLVIRTSELREAEDWERWSNVPKAEALITTAKQMFEAPATPDLGNRLRQLQALWKEVGPMPQRRSKELWEQFKASCDQVYDKVKGVRAVEHEKFAEVTKVKEALIADAESVAESTDFAATAERLKALQAQWKQSGHLPRKQGDELWKRFRAACDRFFERRKPLIDAKQAEEAANLATKHALIARAQRIADGAPGTGGWGKAIGEIKDLQAEWKQVGYVPRRDADVVYRAFRAACDALFAKRDASRDGEANAHRAALELVRAEIAAVMAGGDDVVARAVAVRAKARELDALAPEIEAMIGQIVTAHPDMVKGTELDPVALRTRREKLIARAEELLPKQPAPPTGDVAAQLKQAMRQNAFGDLRFSGRDPVEVIDELRASWGEGGPMLDADDRAQGDRFEAIIARVLDESDAAPRDEAATGRRRRRDRHGQPSPSLAEAATSAPAAIADLAAVPVATDDAVTWPANLPIEPPAPPAVAAPPSSGPPIEDIDTAWDLGADDPTAKPDPGPGTSTPSSTEMAGDGAVEGDGLDTGWD